MGLVNNFTTTANFWEVNPQLQVISPFKELYREDSSRKKKNSSDLMWFIALCNDPDSKFRNIPSEDKVELIGEDFFSDVNFYKAHQDQLDDLSASYQLYTETAAQRALREWEEKIIERARFIKNTTFSMDEYDESGKLRKGTADQLDKMLANTKKLFDDYQRILKDLRAEEEEGGSLKGGAEESLSDSGEI